MTKLKTIISLIVIALVVAGGFTIKHLIEENRILSNNQNAFIANEVAADNEKAVLQLKLSDLKDVINNDALLKGVLRDSLKLQARRINHLTKLTSKTEIKITTELKDTTIYEKDTIYVAKKFSWSDKWYNVNGIISPTKLNDNVNINILGADIIYYLNTDVKYKKFFLCRWFERPTVITKIWNANPYQTIKVEQSITKID